MATRPDYYKTLGVDKESDSPTRSRRPTASSRASTTPTATPANKDAEAPLQGDLPGARRARRPRESGKQYDSGSGPFANRRRPPAAASAGLRQTSTSTPRRWGDILSNLFGGAGPRRGERAGRSRRAPARRASRTRRRPRGAGLDLLRPGPVSGRAGPRCRCRCRRPATRAHGTGAKARHDADRLPPL